MIKSIGDMMKEFIEIDAKVICETEAAILIDDGDTREWIPKSQLEDWPEVEKTGTVLIAEWIAAEKGFI